jgi:hypothetical protein
VKINLGNLTNPEHRVAINAIHLRELGLGSDPDLDISGDTPDWRPVWVTVGKVQKAMEAPVSGDEAEEAPSEDV